MKSCLDLASGSLDNSAKPIILSLTAALFVVRRLGRPKSSCSQG
jgi:hypothetical protein